MWSRCIDISISLYLSIYIRVYVCVHTHILRISDVARIIDKIVGDVFALMLWLKKWVIYLSFYHKNHMWEMVEDLYCKNWNLEVMIAELYTSTMEIGMSGCLRLKAVENKTPECKLHWNTVLQESKIYVHWKNVFKKPRLSGLFFFCKLDNSSLINLFYFTSENFLMQSYKDTWSGDF